MNKPENKTIYTIGHSTHTLAEFLDMLHSFDIKILADIRSLPGSRKFPQFDKENLIISLAETGIQYIHMTDLGGRRKVKKDSKNNRCIWKPKNLKWASSSWKILRQNSPRPICAQKPFGGDVTVRWYPTI